MLYCNGLPTHVSLSRINAACGLALDLIVLEAQQQVFSVLEYTEGKVSRIHPAGQKTRFSFFVKSHSPISDQACWPLPDFGLVSLLLVLFLLSLFFLFLQELNTFIWNIVIWARGFPHSSVGKKICPQCRRPGFYSSVGKIPWRRKWQPTPVFLPGDSHGQRSLAGYCPWGRKSRTWVSD